LLFWTGKEYSLPKRALARLSIIYLSIYQIYIAPFKGRLTRPTQRRFQPKPGR